MKIKILRNKKAQISGILSGIGDAIKTFFDTIPKPVKFLLFLFLILFIGSIAQNSLMVFGTFCDSGEHPVKIKNNIFNNIGLISDIPDPDLVGEEIVPIDEDAFSSLFKEASVCSRKIKYGTITFDDGNTEEITELTNFYNGAYCTNCEEVIIEEKRNNGDTLDIVRGLCYGDVYRLENKSFFKKILCGFSRCEPPKDYYYDSINDVYQCTSDECSGKTAGDWWDEKLNDLGAVYLYPEGENNRVHFENFVGVTCQDLKPRIAVYGIPIFDYFMWLLILVISLLLWALMRFNK